MRVVMTDRGGSVHALDAAPGDALLAADEEERDMLDALGEVVASRAGSRLSCQVTLTAAHYGAALEIAAQPLDPVGTHEGV